MLIRALIAALLIAAGFGGYAITHATWHSSTNSVGAVTCLMGIVIMALVAWALGAMIRSDLRAFSAGRRIKLTR